MKLTRTLISSSPIDNRGSGVSKASGGSACPHFGSAKGALTGENSEICEGTPRTNRDSGDRGERSERDGVTEPQTRHDNERRATITRLAEVVICETHVIGAVIALYPPARKEHNATAINKLNLFTSPGRCNRLQPSERRLGRRTNCPNLLLQTALRKFVGRVKPGRGHVNTRCLRCGAVIIHDYAGWAAIESGKCE